MKGGPELRKGVAGERQLEGLGGGWLFGRPNSRHPQYNVENVKELVQSHTPPKAEFKLGLSDFKVYAHN